MTTRMRLWRAVVLGLSLSAVAACSANPSPAGSGEPGITVLPGSSGGATSSSTAPSAANLIVGPGDFTLLEAAQGLESLASYRARLTKAFEGTVKGVATEWSVLAELAHADNPLVNSLNVETSGAPPESPGRVVEAGGVVYAIPAGETCMAGAAEAADIVRTRAELAELLPGVIGAEKAGAEAIAGVPADRYTFDARALGLPASVKATGQLWIATQASYLVRYTLAVEGGAEYFGADTTGTATWDYELREANQTVTVEVPASCPSGNVEAPTLADATAVTRAPGLLSYATATDIKGVMSFYEGKAKALGWTRTGDPLSDKVIGVLEYSSAAGAVTVFVQAEGGTTIVRIVVDPGAGS